MSWKSKTSLIQEYVSTKRPIDFVPHGQMTVLDCSMSGKERFCKKLDGDYVVLVSDLAVAVSHGLNVNDTAIALDGWIQLPEHALLNIDGSELVVSSYSEFIRSPMDPTQKITVVHITQPLSRSYAQGTNLVLVGFPIQLVGPYDAGSSVIMFDSAVMSVPGDLFAGFRYEDTIPVLDAWQKIQSIQDKTEYLDDNGNRVFRYFAVLQKPLQRSLASDTSVFVKALPAYQSNVLPVNLSGSYYVDAFTGKTFGKGSDELDMSITTYDVNHNMIDSKTYNKNDVLVLSSMPSQDLALWNIGTGIISHKDSNTVFVLDAQGYFSIGTVITKQTVALRLRLQATDSFTVHVVSESTDQTITSIANQVSLELQDQTNHIRLDIKGTSGSRITAITNDISTGVEYIEYSYCPGIDGSESWEGSSLILKPVFSKVSDLYDDLDSMQFNSGVILQ